MAMLRSKEGMMLVSMTKRKHLCTLLRAKVHIIFKTNKENVDYF